MYIITPAYKAEHFIEQCLDASTKQGKVLLGIDGCEATLAVVKKIQKRYKNLRVFYFPKNKGCYLTKNALIDHVPEGETFITFDADDIMKPGMAERMKKEIPCYSRHTGVMCVTKDIWNTLGGYRPWRVHADTDFIRRLKLICEVKKLPKLFYRRYHKGQLTKMRATGLKSDLRNEMRRLTKENLDLEKPQIYFEPEKNIGCELPCISTSVGA